MKIRYAEDRGHVNHGWLDSHHTFSFANFYDPKWMGFKNLRVINEDRIEPGKGFGAHPHKDMEIISYVLEGGLAHKDSMGNIQTIKPGEVQRMSAGTGVVHSEFNHSEQEQTHFLQIWILPNELGIKPSYEQKEYSDEEKKGRLLQVIKPFHEDSKEDQAISIHANASLYLGVFDQDEPYQKELSTEHSYYLHLAKGKIQVNGKSLKAGDAVIFEQKQELYLSEGQAAEVLLFELETD